MRTNEMSTTQEAKGYVETARKILRYKDRREGKIHQNAQTVKLAGHAAYTGTLVALESLLSNIDRECKMLNGTNSNLLK